MIEPFSIVSLCHAARHPEDRSKIDETSTSVFSNEVDSICFVHTDPYISWPPLDNRAWVQNQMTTPLDDDTPLKIGNSTSGVIVAPMILSEAQYRFS